MKACREASLLLSTYPNAPDEDLLEVVIGFDKNQRTGFRKNGEFIRQEKTPDVLNCNEYRVFWVAKVMSTLQFGFGDVNENILLRQPNSKSFTTISFATAVGVVGDWEIFKDSGWI